MAKVTVIIPYKEDRGWLKDAIASVPKDVQLIVSQGDGNWPQNFNKALKDATGDYIKYLHEDDMLTSNCINDSIAALYIQEVDFIHGQSYEIYSNAGRKLGLYTPSIQKPTLNDLLIKNVIHSATTMYHRDVFKMLGGFNEDNKYKSFEEYEFNLRCLMAGMSIGYVDVPLAYYRRHSKQTIRTVDVKQRKQYRQELVNSYL